jgi:hypothetical protein
LAQCPCLQSGFAVESHHRCPGHCRGQSLLITDEYQSPFNVGTVIEMRDFSLSEVSDLNERYGEPLQSTEDLSRFYELFCGQPFLTRLGFAELLRTGSLDRLIAEADIDEGPFGDHLRHLLALLTRATARRGPFKLLSSAPRRADRRVFVARSTSSLRHLPKLHVPTFTRSTHARCPLRNGLAVLSRRPGTGPTKQHSYARQCMI